MDFFFLSSVSFFPSDVWEKTRRGIDKMAANWHQKEKTKGRRGGGGYHHHYRSRLQTKKRRGKMKQFLLLAIVSSCLFPRRPNWGGYFLPFMCVSYRFCEDIFTSKLSLSSYIEMTFSFTPRGIYHCNIKGKKANKNAPPFFSLSLFPFCQSVRATNLFDFSFFSLSPDLGKLTRGETLFSSDRKRHSRPRRARRRRRHAAPPPPPPNLISQTIF